jgi:hypothetical protein
MSAAKVNTLSHDKDVLAIRHCILTDIDRFDSTGVSSLCYYWAECIYSYKVNSQMWRMCSCTKTL